jgi:hypothetical protein
MVADLQRWMQQWRIAEHELRKEKARHLRSMDAEQARAATRAVLSLAAGATVPAWRWRTSGLVEQQRWFQRARSQSDPSGRA